MREVALLDRMQYRAPLVQRTLEQAHTEITMFKGKMSNKVINTVKNSQSLAQNEPREATMSHNRKWLV